MLNNSDTGYGLLTIFIHWITAISVIAMFVVGMWMVDLNYYSQWYKLAPHYHKSVGLLLFAITIARLVWRYNQPHPRPLGTPIENRLASLAHGTLYLLLLTIFISGYLISTADGRGIDLFNWFTVPGLGEFINNQEDIAGEVHEYLAYTLIGLVVLHALASIKHHFINKDSTLTRMLKPTKN